MQTMPLRWQPKELELRLPVLRLVLELRLPVLWLELELVPRLLVQPQQ